MLYFGGNIVLVTNIKYAKDMHKDTPRDCRVHLKATTSSNSPKSLLSYLCEALDPPGQHSFLYD